MSRKSIKRILNKIQLNKENKNKKYIFTNKYIQNV